jgi:hypothetical protein
VEQRKFLFHLRIIGIDIKNVIRNITAIPIAMADLFLPKAIDNRIMGELKHAAIHNPSRPERIVATLFSSLVM